MVDSTDKDTKHIKGQSMGTDPGGLLKYDLGRDVPLRLEK